MLLRTMQAVCEESHVGSTGGEWVRVGFAFMDAATDHFYVGELSDGSARHNLTTLLTQVLEAANLSSSPPGNVHCRPCRSSVRPL